MDLLDMLRIKVGGQQATKESRREDAPRIRDIMQNTTRQNIVLMSLLPKTMPTTSAKGLRRDTRPRVPIEKLMTRKRKSLKDGIARMEVGKGLWGWADSVETGRRLKRPNKRKVKEKKKKKERERTTAMTGKADFLTDPREHLSTRSTTKEVAEDEANGEQAKTKSLREFASLQRV
jgi:hypothetical protein